MATKTASKTTKKAAPAKQHGTCLMTGEQTGSAKSNFRPGMDARAKGALLKVYRGEQPLTSLPKALVAKIRENGAEGLVGFRFGKNGVGDKLEHIGAFTIAEKKEPKAKATKSAKTPPSVSKKAKRGGKALRKAEAQRRLGRLKATEAEDGMEDSDGYEDED